MLFKQHFGQHNVNSLVERDSRFSVLLKNRRNKTKPVMGKVISAIGSLPFKLCRSITLDRGRKELLRTGTVGPDNGFHKSWTCIRLSSLNSAMSRTSYSGHQCYIFLDLNLSGVLIGKLIYIAQTVVNAVLKDVFTIWMSNTLPEEYNGAAVFAFHNGLLFEEALERDTDCFGAFDLLVVDIGIVQRDRAAINIAKTLEVQDWSAGSNAQFVRNCLSCFNPLLAQPLCRRGRAR